MSPITSTPDVCGGVPCIANTRIPVWVIVECRELGLSDDEVLADYPALTKTDLENAVSYFDEKNSLQK